MEIEAAESVGGLWIELMARVHQHYGSGIDSPEFIRAVCMYAIWCDRSQSQQTQEAAWIEFYEYFPKFALKWCTEPVYRKIVADLVSNIGIAEIEKMGCSLEPADLDKFMADTRQADNHRKRKSQKRSLK
jgi:hypothetical protein